MADLERTDAELRERWDRICAAFSPVADLCELRMGQLAAALGEPCFQRWKGVSVRSYIRCSYGKLCGRPGMGQVERGVLIRILDAAVREPDRARATMHQREALAKAARERLAEWKVPPDYPVELLRLSRRLRRIALLIGCQTLADWIAELAELAEIPRRRFTRKVGQKVIAEGFALIEALAAGDAARVRRWIPVARSGRGLSFAAAMKQLIRELPAPRRQMLEDHLVTGKTYAETGAALRLGRARVRQVVQDFRLRVQQFHHYFEIGKVPPEAVADLSDLGPSVRPLAAAVLARVASRPISPTWNRPLPTVTYHPDATWESVGKGDGLQWLNGPIDWAKECPELMKSLEELRRGGAVHRG